MCLTSPHSAFFRPSELLPLTLQPMKFKEHFRILLSSRGRSRNSLVVADSEHAKNYAADWQKRENMAFAPVILDPDISPVTADFQVHRVAVARGMDEQGVRSLVQKHAIRRDLGSLGEPRSQSRTSISLCISAFSGPGQGVALFGVELSSPIVWLHPRCSGFSRSTFIRVLELARQGAFFSASVAFRLGGGASSLSALERSYFAKNGYRDRTPSSASSESHIQPAWRIPGSTCDHRARVGLCRRCAVLD